MPRDQLLGEIAAIGYAAIEIWVRGDDFVSLCEAAAGFGLRGGQHERTRIGRGRP